jgi:hypothetical protein
MSQTWTSDEIKELLLYVQQMKEENEGLRAQLMAAMAKLSNEEAKVKRLLITLKGYTG